MAAITITIPDAVLPRVLDAFAAHYGWTGGGGQTKAQFARQKLQDHVVAVVRAYEAGGAAEAARLAAAAKVDSEITLT